MEIDEAVASLLAERRAEVFVWGRHDCCQTVLSALEVLTGNSLDLRSYATRHGALRELRRLGGWDGAAQALGACPLPNVLLARRGDAVLVRAPGVFGGALALCTGAHAHAAGAVGMVPVPQADWLRAWRLPCLR